MQSTDYDDEIRPTRLKLIVPKTFTIADITWLVRKHSELRYDQTIILFVKKTIPPRTQPIDQVYERYCDSDGMLYITYRGENLVKSTQSFSQIHNTVASMVVFSVFSNLIRNRSLLLENNL